MVRLAQSGLLFALVLPTSAMAADVVSPANGDLVAPKPVFAFDIARGRAEVEVARTADVRTAGEDIGAFVERVASGSFTIGGTYDNSPYVASSLGDPLEAGNYFWHAKVDDYADDPPDAAGPPVPWGPLRRFTVIDAAPVIEGYTLRADRLRKRGKCERVRVRGKVVFTDNSDGETEARLSIQLKAGGRIIGRVRSEVSQYGNSFDGTICTRASRLAVEVALRDDAGNFAPGVPRTVKVKRP